MSMKNIKVWRIFSLSTSLSMILFFTCVICAMFVWPDGYHLFLYCISDLGMVVTYEGNLNIYSSILLFLACFSSSFGGIAFYSMLFFILRHKNTWPLYIGVIMGWVAQYFLMGVAVFPEDTEPMLHQVSAMCFFVFSMVGWFLLLFCIKDCNINRNYKYLGYFLFTIGIIYMVIVIIPFGNDPELHIVLNIWQKVAVINLGCGIWNYNRIFKKMMKDPENTQFSQEIGDIIIFSKKSINVMVDKIKTIPKMVLVSN